MQVQENNPVVQLQQQVALMLLLELLEVMEELEQMELVVVDLEVMEVITIIQRVVLPNLVLHHLRVQLHLLVELLVVLLKQQ